jgi:hypothetical protein
MGQVMVAVITSNDKVLQSQSTAVTYVSPWRIDHNLDTREMDGIGVKLKISSSQVVGG